MPNNASQTEPSILKNILLITPLSLIGHASTLLIYIVLANWFGDPAEMDFIYYYWGIAVFVIQLLSAASAYSVLVPLLAEARAKGETEAQHCVQSIFSRYITIMPWLCCLLVGISWAVSQRFLPNAGLPPATAIGIVCGFLCFAVIARTLWRSCHWNYLPVQVISNLVQYTACPDPRRTVPSSCTVSAMLCRTEPTSAAPEIGFTGNILH